MQLVPLLSKLLCIYLNLYLLIMRILNCKTEINWINKFAESAAWDIMQAQLNLEQQKSYCWLSKIAKRKRLSAL